MFQRIFLPPWALRLRKTRRSALNTCRGFTFIEIMITLVILSVGILAIYRVFFISLEHMSQLNSRLYANIILDDTIAGIERNLRAYKELPLDLQEIHDLDIGVKKITYAPQLKISEVDGFMDVFQVEVAISWEDNHHERRLSRSAFISDFVDEDKETE